jgi:hypothetical protein
MVVATNNLSPAADRMRRTRRRRREGRVYLGIEVSERWLEQLVEAGELSDDDLSNPVALGQVIESRTGG